MKKLLRLLKLIPYLIWEFILLIWNISLFIVVVLWCTLITLCKLIVKGYKKLTIKGKHNPKVKLAIDLAKIILILLFTDLILLLPKLIL